MELKKITFVFRDGDFVTIDGKYVGDFVVGEIKSNFLRNDLTNSIEKNDVANLFAIEIHKAANQVMHQFGMFDLEMLVFDRITNYNDITDIRFTLDDVEYKYIVCENIDADLRVNKDMETYISWHDNLYIFISNKSKLEYYFDYSMINSASYQEEFDALISAE